MCSIELFIYFLNEIKYSFDRNRNEWWNISWLHFFKMYKFLRQNAKCITCQQWIWKCKHISLNLVAYIYARKFCVNLIKTVKFSLGNCGYMLYHSTLDVVQVVCIFIFSVGMNVSQKHMRMYAPEKIHSAM